MFPVCAGIEISPKLLSDSLITMFPVCAGIEIIIL